LPDLSGCVTNETGHSHPARDRSPVQVGQQGFQLLARNCANTAWAAFYGIIKELFRKLAMENLNTNKPLVTGPITVAAILWFYPYLHCFIKG